MTRLTKVRLWPATLVARTVLVLVAGLTVSHLISSWIYTADKRDTAEVLSDSLLAGRISTIVTLVSQAEPDERSRIVMAASDPVFGVSLDLDSEAPVSPGAAQSQLHLALRLQFKDVGDDDIRIRFPPRTSQFATALRHMVGIGDGLHPAQEHLRRMIEAQRVGIATVVSVRLVDGNWLNFRMPPSDTAIFWTPRFVLSMAVMFAAVVGFSLWAVRRVAAPLDEFADAAERLGRNLHDPPMPADGPVEVRRAARAFNTMHARIRHFVEDRTRMVAAISHDLRTPLMRLRFRSEMVEDDEQRAKMANDLEEMERMIAATLAFARDEADVETGSRTDLSGMIQQLAADMAELGNGVEFTGPRDVSINCRQVAIRRALSNLVENALRYGAEARMTLIPGGTDVTILVEDYGPGIPDDQMEAVFKPFFRLDRSRNKDSGGVGLGLSVARDIIRGHGGEVTLRNRAEGGLCAEVRLPV